MKDELETLREEMDESIGEMHIIKMSKEKIEKLSNSHRFSLFSPSKQIYTIKDHNWLLNIMRRRLLDNKAHRLALLI